MTISIYANKSLKLRRGKWLAQFSHVLMMLNLQSHTKQGGTYVTSDKKADYFSSFCKQILASNSLIEINWVNCDSELEELIRENRDYTAEIVDSGRTELKQPTRTCIAIDHSKILKQLHRHNFSNEVIPIKQIICVRSDLGLTKNQQYTYSVALSNKIFDTYSTSKNNEILFRPTTDILSWINNGMAKIGLKITSESQARSLTNSANQFQLTYNELEIDDALAVIVFEPHKKDDIDRICNELKLY